MAAPLDLAGGALSAFGSIAQGNAAAAQANTDAAMAKENARIARMNAVNIQQAGMAAEEAKRRQIVKDLGRSAAAMSQAGTGGPSVGSNALLAKQAGTDAEFDAKNLRYGYQMDAYSEILQANNQTAAAAAARQRARQAQTAGYIGAVSSLLNAGASYSQLSSQQSLIRAQTEALRRSQSNGGLVPYGAGARNGSYGVVPILPP